MTEPLVVLYDDPHLIAVAKTAGLLTQGLPSGEPTLEEAVRRFMGNPTFLGTVHRLDRPVSGVVVWAKTPKAARRLSEEFASRRVFKEYWAVVEGCRPEPSRGEWEDWLIRSTDATGRISAVDPRRADARRAVTRFELADEGHLPEGMLWLRFQPETGRTHQLRVQSSLRGLPVWGDALYGSTRGFPNGIALHARLLAFSHPILKRAVTLTASLPINWAAAGIELPES